MSHTVIPDHRDRALKLENVSNRLVHHCRIVNVKWKPQPAPDLSGITIKSADARPSWNAWMHTNHRFAV